MTDVAQPSSEVSTSRRRMVSRTPARGSVRTKGVVTIPQEIRRLVDLDVGDEVIFTVEDGRVVLTPAAVIPRDQAWFWTPRWQAKEAEADAEADAGVGTVYHNDEEFLAAIKAV